MAKPFNASFRFSGQYDDRVGSTSDLSKGNLEDIALVTRLNAGYQMSFKDNFGLRFDYFGYADFHQNYRGYNLDPYSIRDYDVIDQTVSMEPQYSVGNIIYSLPFAYNLVLEDNKSDFYRYTISPTVTFKIPQYDQAVAINAIAAKIYDKDDIPELDEDGFSYGVGCAYLILFNKLSRIRLSLDYQRARYDARVIDYGAFADEPGWPQFSHNLRTDDLLSANIDVEYNFTKNIGVFTSYTFIHTDSNVDVYAYNRNIVEVGVTLQY